MREEDIRDFWQAHPCGENLMDTRLDRSAAEDFFRRYDAMRYSLEDHIPACLDRFGFGGQEVLEIGLGQGADSEQLVRRGAHWSGLDLTDEAVERVKLRMKIRDLPYRDCRRGSALDIPWPDATFDSVYSHGVLHHIPDIQRAQAEIARVLKPGGRLVAMLYAKHSLNYWVSIGVIRRVALVGLRAVGADPGGKIGRHVQLSRERGLRDYLAMRNFIHRNTDGPDNVYSKVYTRSLAEQDFPAFRVRTAFKRFLYAPPIPKLPIPGASLLGWHLWLEMVKR
jgi:SAM-dependent methyltransferase